MLHSVSIWNQHHAQENPCVSFGQLHERLALDNYTPTPSTSGFIGIILKKTICILAEYSSLSKQGAIHSPWFFKKPQSGSATAPKRLESGVAGGLEGGGRGAEERLKESSRSASPAKGMELHNGQRGGIPGESDPMFLEFYACGSHLIAAQPQRPRILDTYPCHNVNIAWIRGRQK